MRCPGRSGLTFLFVSLAFSTIAHADPPDNFGRDKTLNGLSGHAIIPFALSRVHDRSPVQSAIETRLQAMHNLRVSLTSKNNDEAETTQLIRAFLTKLLSLSPPEPRQRSILTPEIFVDPLKTFPAVRAKLKDISEQEKITFEEVERQFAPLVRSVIPLPKQLLSLDWNYRQVRDGTNQRDIAFHAPSVLYSHRPSGFDIGFQHLPEGSMGLALRYHFSSFRTINPNELTREEADRWVQHAFEDNVAAFFGYRNIPGSGHSFDYGVSYSKLCPLPPNKLRPSKPGPRTPEKPGPGIMIQLAVQALAINPEQADDKTFAPFGFGISWQNEIPFVQEETIGNETKFTIRRWSWRFGFEYGRVPNYPFGTAFGNAYTFVFRARDKGSGEYTFLYGKTAQGDDYFGITLGTFIKWN